MTIDEATLGTFKKNNSHDRQVGKPIATSSKQKFTPFQQNTPHQAITAPVTKPSSFSPSQSDSRNEIYNNEL
jgi:hypothetical protein